MQLAGQHHYLSSAQSPFLSLMSAVAEYDESTDGQPMAHLAKWELSLLSLLLLNFLAGF